MLRRLFALVFLLGLAYGIAYVVAGRGAPPKIAIGKPERVIGQTGPLEVNVEAPGGRFTDLMIALEQNGKTIPLFALAGASASALTHVDNDHVRIARDIGRRTIPELQAGAARIVVNATRPSFLNLRQL